MRTPSGHRKLVKHDDAMGEAHALTFSCYRRLPLLRLNSRCELLADSIDNAMASQHYELLAFVFMPEHVHLLVLPLPAATGIATLLFAIKRPVSYRVKQRLIEEGDPMLSQLTIRDRPGNVSFRFWQEGPGYDRNVRRASTMHTEIDYLHMNPVRRGLVDHPSKWKWSSWRAYEDEPCNAPTRPNVAVWS